VELLLADVLGQDRLWLLSHRYDPLPADARDRFAALVRRRADHEPFAYLVGLREFWSLPFSVSPDVLVPRPDSETIVAAALQMVPDQALRIADLGTGSGCLLLSVLHERPQATGLGVDLSGAALVIARRNAIALGLADRCDFVRGDWFEPVAGRFDLVMSNPPYIPSVDIPSLMPEVAQHEPHLALDGGPDGLVPYRVIVPEARRRLKPAGVLVLEVGAGQADAVMQLARAAGFGTVEALPDLAGVRRCVRAFGASEKTFGRGASAG
jgi:release factor glutamine methyltransferase